MSKTVEYHKHYVPVEPATGGSYNIVFDGKKRMLVPVEPSKPDIQWLVDAYNLWKSVTKERGV